MFKNSKSKFSVLASAAFVMASCGSVFDQQAPSGDPDFDEVAEIFEDVMILSAQTSITNPDMAVLGLEAMTSMLAQLQIELTIPDGYTLYDVIDNFENLPQLTRNLGVTEDQLASLGMEAIDEMIDKIDLRADYLTPDELEQLLMRGNNSYAGVGLGVRKADQDGESGHILVTHPIPDGPGEDAGILGGDLITHIEGESTESMTLQEAVDKIKGAPGSDVTITIQRENEAPFDATLTREVIVQSSVSSKIVDNDIGYVRLTQFSSDVDIDMIQAIRDLQDQSTSELQGYILDLRGNPGGGLGEALEVSDAFLDSGEIVSIHERGQIDRHSAKLGDVINGKPLFVLINQRSASASELTAGALQDNGRATILGIQSYGKGTVQSIYRLQNGGGFKLTTANYVTPSGDSIQLLGITPDIEFIPQDPLDIPREIDNLGALENPETGQSDTQTSATCEADTGIITTGIDLSLAFEDGSPDYQLICAVENLKGAPAYTSTKPVEVPDSLKPNS